RRRRRRSSGGRIRREGGWTSGSCRWSPRPAGHYGGRPPAPQDRLLQASGDHFVTPARDYRAPFRQRAEESGMGDTALAERPITRRDRTLRRLGLVVPVYNEESAIAPFHAAVSKILDTLDCGAEILFVDDGSRDATRRTIRELGLRDPRVRL